MKRGCIVFAALTLCLALCGCVRGESLLGAWQAEGMDGVVFEFGENGSFFAYLPGDPGNTISGSYRMGEDGEIAIRLDGERERYAGAFEVRHDALKLTLMGEVQYFTRLPSARRRRQGGMGSAFSENDSQSF